MASRVHISIDGVAIKPPLQADFRIAEYIVTDMKRNAAGTMNGQYLDKKIKLFFKYPAIMGYELYPILRLLQTTNLFHKVEFTLDGYPYTKYMYVGDMNRTLHRTGPGQGYQSGWCYKDVSFNLIER